MTFSVNALVHRESLLGKAMSEEKQKISQQIIIWLVLLCWSMMYVTLNKYVTCVRNRHYV